MLDPRLGEDEVRAIIADLTAEHPKLGASARDAWMSLTGGQGPGALSLAALQYWLWWLVPKRSLHEDYEYWVDLAAGAAALFDRLGSVPYAAVCRSETTAQVLAAWRQSRGKGRAASRKALNASPVRVPDLDDFSWGDLFGVWEGGARAAVEDALEQAIAEGRLDPTIRNWKKVAAAICAETLDADHPGQIDQSWRSLTLSERAESWACGPHVPAEDRAERQRIANRLLVPPELPPPEVTAGPLGLLGWLAVACAEGVTLTPSGELPLNLVLDATRAHGWWESDPPPRGEDDVQPLRLVHHAARRLGILRRRGNILVTTRAGRAVATDPATWWPRLVLLGQGADAYRDALYETVLLKLIDGARHVARDLGAEVGAAMEPQHWRRPEGLVTADAHAAALYMIINRWQIWGYVDFRLGTSDETPPAPVELEPGTVALTRAGQAAAGLWLHRRITGPRHDF